MQQPTDPAVTCIQNTNASDLLREAEKASSVGDLQALDALMALGCPLSPILCASASVGGQLEALHWLRQRGCPWDGEVLSNAVRNENKELLEWAYQNGAPLDDSVYVSAASLHGDESLHYMLWACERECPVSKNLPYLLMRVDRHDLVHWLVETGVVDNMSLPTDYWEWLIITRPQAPKQGHTISPPTTVKTDLKFE